MIKSKRLIAKARKWQKLASMGRKTISISRSNGIPKEEALRQQPMDNKGTFVVYISDGRCFSVPLAYLNSPIFQELHKILEDEYGLPSDRPIMLPYDAVFMSCIVSLIQDTMSKDV